MLKAQKLTIKACCLLLMVALFPRPLVLSATTKEQWLGCLNVRRAIARGSCLWLQWKNPGYQAREKIKTPNVD
ncbi:hypothetical protein WA1_34040 [Scytonema hofmannii PCC 7110]|uniref:Secreted protein n=1 Tax=Scytonema hofmannii PCC 7110 TaxID=128403 RepID=A0A139X2Y5_9CYAN|nr:hypothetical protein [Scytonema hofmannii]KYC39013.1 hypothetical protein WA1_34040 [Scytonema hofmannii PCC 7110]